MSYTIKVPSLGEFYEMLESHDFLYEMSDDHKVWEAGSKSERRLEEIAKGNPEHQKLLDGFRIYHFSGEPWKTDKMPKPVRPE